MNPMNMLRDMRTIKQLLMRAEAVAHELGDAEPGAEHLLLASLDLPDGAAGRILGGFGIDGERLRDAIVGQHADALVVAGVDQAVAGALADAAPVDAPSRAGPYRASASAQEAFQAAGELARSSKERFGSAHVVAAVAAMEHGVAARALARLGVDRAELLAASREERRTAG